LCHFIPQLPWNSTISFNVLFTRYAFSESLKLANLRYHSELPLQHRREDLHTFPNLPEPSQLTKLTEKIKLAANSIKLCVRFQLQEKQKENIVRMDFEVKVADFSFEFCLVSDERFAFESVSAVLSDSIFLLFINYTLDGTAWRTPHVDLTPVHLNEDMFHTLRILRTM